MFAEDKIDWSEKWVAQGWVQGWAEGWAQGRAQGRAEGRAEVLAEMLTLLRDVLAAIVQSRFGDPVAERVSPWLEKISDYQTLREVRQLVSACESPEVLLDRLQSV